MDSTTLQDGTRAREADAALAQLHSPGAPAHDASGHDGSGHDARARADGLRPAPRFSCAR